MADPVPWLVVEKGWKVLAADGSEIGTVAETLGDERLDIFDGISVATKLIGKPLYVPSEQVGEIREGTVQLRLTPEQVDDLEPVE